MNVFCISGLFYLFFSVHVQPQLSETVVTNSRYRGFNAHVFNGCSVHAKSWEKCRTVFIITSIVLGYKSTDAGEITTETRVRLKHNLFLGSANL